MPAERAPIPTFVSFAHDDVEDLKALRRHLTPVIRGRVLEVWDDGRLSGGQQWSQEIEQAIARSRIFVLLLTPSFLASDYILEKELPAIRRSWESPGTLVLPILLRNCFWRHVVAALQVIPTDDSGKVRAIYSWRRREDAFQRAAEQVDKALEAHVGDAAPPLIDWTVRGTRS